MKHIIKRVGEQPVIADEDLSLEYQQGIVGGWIEGATLGKNNVFVTWNDQGRIPPAERFDCPDWIEPKECLPNCYVYISGYRTAIHGDFLVHACDANGDNRDMTEAELKHHMRQLELPYIGCTI